MPAKRVKIQSVVIRVALCSVALLGQQKSAGSGAVDGREFPVTMRQRIEAGKTAVGTKVEAELALAAPDLLRASGRIDCENPLIPPRG